MAIQCIFNTPLLRRLGNYYDMICLHDPLLVCEMTEHDFTRNDGRHSMKNLTRTEKESGKCTFLSGF